MMQIMDAEPGMRRQWLDWWQLTGREPFAHPDYVALFAEPGDTILAIAWSDPAGGEALLPLIRRPLPSELLADQDRAQGSTDIISPYGFGGPFAVGSIDWPSFYGRLLEWMRSENVVTGFIRTHPADDSPRDLQVEGYAHRHVADNIVVLLSRSSEDQWRHYEHKVRKNVNKAKRAGLRVEIRRDMLHLDEFVEIYTDTMQRRHADSWYFFSRQVFERLGAALPDSFLVAEVREPSGRIVSIELVLISERFLYSYLGGTRRDAFRYAPNDLLKHAVIDLGREQGKTGYVLGGGYKPDDGIFRYKRAFDVDGCRPFIVVQLTAHAQLDQELTRARVARVKRDQPGAVLAQGFFPAYRATSSQPLDSLPSQSTDSVSDH